MSLSVLDWHDHAINESRAHPSGVLTAECGHLLMVVTPLRATPCGTRCEACAAATRDADAPGGPVNRPPARWTRSPLDCSVHLLDGCHPSGRGAGAMRRVTTPSSPSSMTSRRWEHRANVAVWYYSRSSAGCRSA